MAKLTADQKAAKAKATADAKAAKAAAKLKAIQDKDKAKLSPDQLAAAQALHDKYNMTDLNRPDKRTMTGVSLSELNKAIANKAKTGKYGGGGNAQKPVNESLNRFDTMEKAHNGTLTGLSDKEIATLKTVVNAKYDSRNLNDLDKAKIRSESLDRQTRANQKGTSHGTGDAYIKIGQGMEGPNLLNKPTATYEYSQQSDLRSIKKVEGYDNVYRVRVGSWGSDDKDYTTEYYIKGQDGTFKQFGLDRLHYDAPEQKGMGSMGTIIGAVVAFSNPMGLGLVASGALGGAIGGALSTGSISGAVKGGIAGAIGGAVGQSTGLSVGSLGDQAATAIGQGGNTSLATAINSGIKGAAGAGTSSLLGGGDFSDVLSSAAIGGLSSGLGNYAGSAAGAASGSATIGNTVGGAVGGATYSGLKGDSALNGALAGGGAGLVSGVVSGITGSNAIGGAVGNTAGGLINTALNTSDINGSTTNTGGSTTTATGGMTTTPSADVSVSQAAFNPLSANYRDLRASRNIDFSQRGW